MPDIPLGSQVFDLAFHPTSNIVYTGLLTGQVKAFSYDEQGAYESKFSITPSKRSCRGLDLNADGSRLWSVGKGKSAYTIDTETATIVESRVAAHEATINRVKYLMPWLVSTGDDDGVVKMWDPRQSECVRTYTHHFDFISDFLWLSDKKQLVASSGDGTLSVMDVRSKKVEPFAHSEDQEDELLSLLLVKGDAKVVVGTQIGILSIFNRSSGWGDCVDRIPGHPHSVDALCALPSEYSSSGSTILTGSSDGFVRAIEILPTKLVGIVVDHGQFPVERIAIDRGGEGRWIGSLGHDDILKLTDLKDVFEDEKKDEEQVNKNLDQDDDEMISAEEQEEENPTEEPEEVNESNDDSDASEAPKQRKRKRKPEKDQLAGKKKKGRNEIEAEPSFFSDI